jgi:hypothetical protein
METELLAAPFEPSLMPVRRLESPFQLRLISSSSKCSERGGTVGSSGSIKKRIGVAFD